MSVRSPTDIANFLLGSVCNMVYLPSTRHVKWFRVIGVQRNVLDRTKNLNQPETANFG